MATQNSLVLAIGCALILSLQGQSALAQDSASTNAPVTAASLEDGLILQFEFDQPPVGGRILDTSGFNNDGHAINVQWVGEGHRGGSIQFAKDNSYITVPNNAGINPPRLTLAAWIKTSYSDAIWRRIFDKGTAIDYDLTMGGDTANGDKKFRGDVALEVGKSWKPSGVPVTDGKWHQVVGTYDGKFLRIYVDGMLLGKPAQWVGVPTPVMWDLTIGANRSNPGPGEAGPSFNGQMDDVRMYSRPLSPDEVKFLYNSTKTTTDVTLTLPPPPQAPASQNNSNVAARLKAVKDLYNQGLITKDQYDQKVKDIMGSM